MACSTLLRFWAGALVPVPWIAPDEFVYAELGRSLYASGRFELLGEPLRFYTLVFPLLVGGPLSLGEHGYVLLKGVQALVMSLTAVPVYLWARTLTTRGHALTAAALTLAIPGLAYSGLIMTEVAFYPISLLAAWTLARALERPSLGRQALLVAAVLVAVATRLQAVALVPVVVSAVVCFALLERDPRLVRRFLPTAGAFAAAGAAWSAYQLRGGGPATDVLGAYRAAGESGYDLHDAALFVLYHAADLVLMTGLVPVAAVAVLLVEAARGREESRAVRAYLSVTLATCVWFVLEVGVFASRHVGRLAERDLLALVPLLFVGLAVWVGRGAPRARLAAPLAALGALGLVSTLPVEKLVSLAAIPDAFTLIPLYRLGVRAPSVDLELVVDLAAAVAAAAVLLVPRRLAWTLPAALLVGFAAISFSASRVVTAQATLVRQTTLGASKRWIDEAAPSPVAYLYTNEVYWNAVWQSLFWNRKVDAVYNLLDSRVPGLVLPSVGPLEDGRLVHANGAPVEGGYVVAASRTTFVGERVAEAPGADLFLWRLDPPFRLAEWTHFLPPRGGVGVHAETRAYACVGGTLRLRLVAGGRTSVELRREGALFRRLRLAPGQVWEGSVPALPPRPFGKRLCRFEVLSPGPLVVDLARFDRASAPPETILRPPPDAADRDNTAWLQARLDEGPGRIVLPALPDGACYPTRGLWISHGSTELVSDGACLRSLGPGPVRLRSADGDPIAASAVLFVNRSSSEGPAPEQVLIRGFRIVVPPGVESYGVGIFGHDVTVRGVTIEGSPIDGIVIEGRGNGVDLARDAAVVDCRVNGARRNGISAAGVVGLRIERSQVVDTTGDYGPGSPGAGIDLEPDDTLDPTVRVRIAGNRITGNAGPGILLALATSSGLPLRADGLSIERNVVTGNGRGGGSSQPGGVVLHGGQRDGRGRLEIAGNTVRDNAGAGLQGHPREGTILVVHAIGNDLSGNDGGPTSFVRLGEGSRIE